MSTKGESVTKKMRALALAAGAKTESEFAMYANLVESCTTLKKQKCKSLNGVILRYEFLLERGRFFESQPLPKGFTKKAAKSCYDNSFKLALSKEGLTYCEGDVVILLGKEKATAIEHGWCVTEDGKVIDVTLREPGVIYFGSSFKSEEMMDIDFLPLIYNIIEKRLEE